MVALARQFDPQTLHHVQFPNETAAYRGARNALLAEEMELRRQIEQVAAHRRALPEGGQIPEDYVFDRAGPDGQATRVKFSRLFERTRDTPTKDTLAVYSFMFGPEREQPCPGCTHFLDSLDGAAPHILQRINLVVVAKSPLPRLLDLARKRGWRNLVLLSTAGNTYDRDYFGDSTALPAAVRRQQDFTDGEEWDMPILNVFRRDGDTIRHFWGSELLYVPAEPAQEYRHNDLLNPLWNMLDLTPDGRGNFQPQVTYG
jgi:predicted dithiol-disulfide oxidoreductase (DUF899 family)